MFNYKNIRDQLVVERRKNEQLQAALIKANSDLEYVAMMTDVELEQEDEENGDEQI